jgi:hypothetical protein
MTNVKFIDNITHSQSGWTLVYQMSVQLLSHWPKNVKRVLSESVECCSFSITYLSSLCWQSTVMRLRLLSAITILAFFLANQKCNSDKIEFGQNWFLKNPPGCKWNGSVGLQETNIFFFLRLRRNLFFACYILKHRHIYRLAVNFMISF